MNKCNKEKYDYLKKKRFTIYLIIKNYNEFEFTTNYNNSVTNSQQF